MTNKYFKQPVIGIGVTILIIIILYGVYLVIALFYSIYPFQIYHPNPDKTSGLYVDDKEKYSEKLTEEGKKKRQNVK